MTAEISSDGTNRSNKGDGRTVTQGPASSPADLGQYLFVSDVHKWILMKEGR